jgi:hypothetical protein
VSDFVEQKLKDLHFYGVKYEMLKEIFLCFVCVRTVLSNVTRRFMVSTLCEVRFYSGMTDGMKQVLYCALAFL